jgi:hypothetical protein
VGGVDRGEGAQHVGPRASVFVEGRGSGGELGHLDGEEKMRRLASTSRTILTASRPAPRHTNSAPVRDGWSMLRDGSSSTARKDAVLLARVSSSASRAVKNSTIVMPTTRLSSGPRSPPRLLLGLRVHHSEHLESRPGCVA